MKKRRCTLLVFFLLTGLLMGITPTPVRGQALYLRLREYCRKLPDSFINIPTARKDTLQRIANYVLEKKSAGEQANLLFADVYNAKVSQLAELWCYVAIHYYHVKNISVFSGGLQPSCFDHRIVNPIQHAGMIIVPPQVYSSNLLYYINISKRLPDYTMFSKPVDFHLNPHHDYLLVVTSDKITGILPGRYGANQEVLLFWDDPSAWDDSPVEQKKYEACAEEIARDMFYLINYIKKEEKSSKKQHHKKKDKK